MEILDTQVYLEDQVQRVSLVSQEPLDVQGSMVPKEREETPALEDSQDHKVSPDPEENPESQVSQDRAWTEAGGRMVFLGGPEQRACLERCWEPRLGPPGQTVSQELLETRASLGHQEDQDHLVLTDVLVFLDGRESVGWMVFPVFPDSPDYLAVQQAAFQVHRVFPVTRE